MAQSTDLQRAYIFQGLPPADLEKAAAAAQEVSYNPGDYVYKKGDKGQTFYIIAEGKVELIAEGLKNSNTVFGHISEGGHFGEASLFTDKPRSLTVRAITTARLLCFDQEQFETVLLANPLLHRALDKALAERLVLSSHGDHDFGVTIEPILDPGKTWITEAPSMSDQEANHQADGKSLDFDFEGTIDLARKIQKQIQQCAADEAPVLISGESGTGRRLVAKQIHLHSAQKSMPYIELDLRQYSPWIWVGKLFGYERDPFPYSTGRQLGVFEQLHEGTVVLHHAETLGEELQKKLYQAIVTGKFTTIDGKTEHPFKARVILIAGCDPATLEKESVFIPELLILFKSHIFTLPPLREHKRDIQPLVEYYLKRYSAGYNKRVTKISPDALGLLMKYDWPGNLTELSNVIHRAVMVTQQDEIISEQILFGLPRTEGKMVYNLLRIPWIRRIIESKLYPTLPKVIVTILFCIGILTLFLGPQEPENNLGLTLSWYIGWPLLIISFFFLPRFWCSICALSAPGKLIQTIIKPSRRVPAFITNYSGWIMAMFCLVVFWVEIVWNAYENPWLTGMILLSITFGALLFSIFFQRYTWCRYLCPLGALNAIFSMPSILELRANRQMCENHCHDHACYRGTDERPGCPMFRHPFLVDNNKDCILCGRCIQNCKLHSTQLNLRLAPQELWSIQSPRSADSFLVASLGVIYFLLVRHHEFQEIIQNQSLLSITNSQTNGAITGSLIFWGLVALSWGGYSVLCWLQAVYTNEEYTKIRDIFGYGLIPLVLGGYLAFYVKMFIQGAWRLLPNLLLLFGVESAPHQLSSISPQTITTLLHIIIIGGLLACLFATYKIFHRLEMKQFSPHHLLIPFLFITALGFAYLRVI
jgi:polyferredoxin